MTIGMSRVGVGRAVGYGIMAVASAAVIKKMMSKSHARRADEVGSEAGTGAFGDAARGVNPMMSAGVLDRREEGLIDDDVVTEASDESFPASDPPSWTPVSSPTGTTSPQTSP